jgi:hypothetical protein
MKLKLNRDPKKVHIYIATKSLSLFLSQYNLDIKSAVLGTIVNNPFTIMTFKTIKQKTDGKWYITNEYTASQEVVTQYHDNIQRLQRHINYEIASKQSSSKE